MNDSDSEVGKNLSLLLSLGGDDFDDEYFVKRRGTRHDEDDTIRGRWHDGSKETETSNPRQIPLQTLNILHLTLSHLRLASAWNTQPPLIIIHPTLNTTPRPPDHLCFFRILRFH
ncbi:hypothetical protein AN958_10472 [Leucoagaricus sp. SymC.cos]|nr:hypothetical protein AN958_10472 [Leucoagaricus sp. SymC.cos]